MRQRRSRLYCSLLAFAIAISMLFSSPTHPAQAQTSTPDGTFTLYGTITEAGSGIPLTQSVITFSNCLSEAYTTQTDLDGHYSLTVPEPFMTQCKTVTITVMESQHVSVIDNLLVDDLFVSSQRDYALEVLPLTDIPTQTPLPTNTITITPTVTPTATASNTRTPTATRTATNTKTNTPPPSMTFTPSNTFTPSATRTPLTPTVTLTRSMTPTPSRTFTPSLTRTPTRTPTPLPSKTFTPTNTMPPSNTPTDVPSLTPTDTDTPTAEIPTNTPTTQSPTDTPTLEPSPTDTDTPTVVPFTETPTETLTDLPTSTPTELPTNTDTPTLVPPTETPTDIPTETPTATPTDLPTSTSTSTYVTATPTATATKTRTPRPTPTSIPTGTGTATASPTPSATPTSTPTLPPTTWPALADSYVRSGTGANLNFGTAATLYTQNGNRNNKRESYLKFDLTLLATISSAKLRLYGSVPVGVSIPVEVLAVPNQTWIETGITWNNKPAYTAPALTSVTVSGTTNVWYEWDITAYVQQQKALGATSISLALHNNTLLTYAARFNSRNNASNQPQLVVLP